MYAVGGDKPIKNRRREGKDDQSKTERDNKRIGFVKGITTKDAPVM